MLPLSLQISDYMRDIDTAHCISHSPHQFPSSTSVSAALTAASHQPSATSATLHSPHISRCDSRLHIRHISNIGRPPHQPPASAAILAAALAVCSISHPHEPPSSAAATAASFLHLSPSPGVTTHHCISPMSCPPTSTIVSAAALAVQQTVLVTHHSC